MKSTSSINQDQFLQIAENICEGLRHIHQCGYLHGDIKSNNILIANKTQICNQRLSTLENLAKLVAHPTVV